MPVGTTDNYDISLFADGENPGAVALNDNWVAIDAQMKANADALSETSLQKIIYHVTATSLGVLNIRELFNNTAGVLSGTPTYDEGLIGFNYTTTFLTGKKVLFSSITLFDNSDNDPGNPAIIEGYVFLATTGNTEIVLRCVDVDLATDADLIQSRHNIVLEFIIVDA